MQWLSGRGAAVGAARAQCRYRRRKTNAFGDSYGSGNDALLVLGLVQVVHFHIARCVWAWAGGTALDVIERGPENDERSVKAMRRTPRKPTKLYRCGAARCLFTEPYSC